MKNARKVELEEKWKKLVTQAVTDDLFKTKLIEKGLRGIERAKASTRAEVEHPFRVIKCQFGFTKVRYKGLAKNTAQLHTLFALANLWMARKQLMRAG